MKVLVMLVLAGTLVFSFLPSIYAPPMGNETYWPPFTSEKHPYGTPLYQFRGGVLAEEIRCDSGLVLVIKNNGNPACVKSLSVVKLVERGWATKVVSPTVFDVFVNGTKYEIPYHVTGLENKVLNMTVDLPSKSFIVTMEAKNNGVFTITLPRELIDATTNNHDNPFFVLVNREETSFKEAAGKLERTIELEFGKNTSQIEIIGISLI